VTVTAEPKLGLADAWRYRHARLLVGRSRASRHGSRPDPPIFPGNPLPRIPLCLRARTCGDASRKRLFPLSILLQLDALRRDRPTVLPMVPTAIQLILSNPELSQADFSSVRRVIYFGSPIGVALLARALERFRCEFLQYYGTSETWIISALRHKQHLLGNSQWLASCGTPIPLVSMKIADASGAETAPGTVGEILVRSPLLFSGYYRPPAATAAAITDGWYRTGDLGRRDE
jgi:acyl-CoA synthetase (AMP-forming)/AMP-acid ligase II